MPYAIKQRKGKYIVYNSDTGKEYGKHETIKKAEAQRNLLYGVENKWKPKKQ